MPAARVAAPDPVVNSMFRMPGAVSKTISAIARPSSLLVGVPSSRTCTWPGGELAGPGRSPVACDPATPAPTRLIELETMPTATPAPVGPSARACGPRCAASPSESTLPALVPLPCTASTARVLARPATSVSALTGSVPSTMRCGWRFDTARISMPCARSASRAASMSPVTWTSTSTRRSPSASVSASRRAVAVRSALSRRAASRFCRWLSSLRRYAKRRSAASAALAPSARTSPLSEGAAGPGA